MNFEKSLTVINPIDLGEVRNKTVCIVRFGKLITENDVRPGIFYQVTVDPLSYSPDGRFIRFGQHPGDEIIGWQPVEWMVIESILGEWVEGQPPTLHFSPFGGTTVMLE